MAIQNIPAAPSAQMSLEVARGRGGMFVCKQEGEDDMEESGVLELPHTRREMRAVQEAEGMSAKGWPGPRRTPCH